MSQQTPTGSEYCSPVRKIALYSGQASSTKKAKNVSKGRNGTPVKSKDFYRLEVIYNDGGITIDVLANQTVDSVMEFVCFEWLNILRNGDGLVDDHSWTVKGPPLTTYENIDLDKCGDRRTLEWRDAHEICEKSREMIPATEKLENIKGFDTGMPLTVVYGVQRSTTFKIQMVGRGIAKWPNRFPYQVPSSAHKFAERFHLSNPSFLYHPPPSSPNLNDIFPHANKAMFGHGNRWFCPYPTSPMCGGFICGEFQRCFDVLFLPYKSSSLHEALVIMDSLMSQYPEFKGDSSSRIGLPLSLSNTREAKFKAYQQEPGCDNRINAFIPNKKFSAFVNPHNRIVSRIDGKKLREYKNVVANMFPSCSVNYGKGLWASYRNGKVIIGEGRDRSGEERGVPMHIYVEAPYKVRSLHEFFCVCETLLARATELSVPELDGLFGSLRM